MDIAATWLTPAKKLLPKKIFPLKEETSCTYPKIINFSNDKAKILPKNNSHLPEKNDFPPKEKISYNYLKKKKKNSDKKIYQACLIMLIFCPKKKFIIITPPKKTNFPNEKVSHAYPKKFFNFLDEKLLHLSENKPKFLILTQKTIF